MVDPAFSAIVLGCISAIGMLGAFIIYQITYIKGDFNFFRTLMAKKIWLVLDDLGTKKISSVPLDAGEIAIYNQRYKVNENWIEDGICYGEYYNKNFVQRRLYEIDISDIKRFVKEQDEKSPDTQTGQVAKCNIWIKDANAAIELAETNVDFLVALKTDITEMVGQDVMEAAKSIMIMVIFAMTFVFALSQTYNFAADHLMAPKVAVTCDWQYNMINKTTSTGNVTVVQPTGIVESLVKMVPGQG